MANIIKINGKNIKDKDAVHYSVADGASDAQKAQALANIGGASAAEVADLKGAISQIDNEINISFPELEIGNIALNGTALNYTDNAKRVRTKQGEILQLKKGTIIGVNHFTNYYLRVLYAKSTSYSSINLSVPFYLPYDANVVLCLWKKNDTATTISEAREEIYISRPESVSNAIIHIEEEIEELQNYNCVYNIELIPKGFNDSGIEIDSTTRICSDFFRVNPGDNIITDLVGSKEINFAINYYTVADYETARSSATSWLGNKTSVIVPTGINYIRLIIGYTDNSTISVTDFSKHVFYKNAFDLQNNVKDIQSVIGFECINLISKGFDSDGLEINSTTRVCSDYIPVSANEVIYVDAVGSKATEIGFNFYEYNDYSTARSNYTNWLSNKKCIIVPSDTNYIRFLIRYTDNSTIYPNEFSRCALFRVVNNVINENYSVGSDFVKRSIHMSHKGIIRGLQSFCKYDGSYYSTDGAGGGHIFIQNSAFELTDTISLNVGHGNSFQLGSDGKAYVSGWDDDNVYVIDLKSITIIDTIQLPVTGYTTCAVDDLNGIMYIFKRTTLPTTEENYDFIVWDYVNDEIKLTKKTIPFYAMQACDFYAGKIFVNYGLGNQKNGYLIFNTNGDVISELVIGALDVYEPQGVFFDRSTKELLISYTSGHLYSVYGA